MVAPTPPAGVQPSSPRAVDLRGPAPTGASAGPVAARFAAGPSDRGAGPLSICPHCQTRNPLESRFCVSCGVQLPEIVPVSPHVRPQLIAPTQPDANIEGAAIKGAAVVSVAPDRAPAPPATTVCDRCQGVCEATMRFCKYCGAPLAQGDAGRLAAASREPARVRDAAEQARPVVHAGLQAALEEAARQGSPPAPPRARFEPAGPTLRPAALSPGAEKWPAQRPGADSAAVHGIDPGRRLGAGGGPDPSKQGVAAPTDHYAVYPPASSTVSGRLIVITSDGREGQSFPLSGEQIDVGRHEGSVVFPDDKYMSPRHARLLQTNGQWYVRDLGSTNGVYVRITKPHALVDGDLLLLGVEVLRFENIPDAELGLGPAMQHGTLVFGSPALPRCARLVQRTVEGLARDVYHLHRLETAIGRESGDIVFSDDPFMSRRHALIRREKASGMFILIDLDSSNGTFVAMRGDCALRNGDSIRVGQHLFRVELTQG